MLDSSLGKGGIPILSLLLLERGGDSAQEVPELSQGQNSWDLPGAGGHEEPDLLPRVSNRDMSHSLGNQCQQDLLGNLMPGKKDFGVSAAKEGT